MINGQCSSREEKGNYFFQSSGAGNAHRPIPEWNPKRQPCQHRRDAPISTLVTIPSRRIHFSAICARLSPRSAAIAFRLRILLRRSSLNWSAWRKRPSVLTRLSFGIPFRYLSVSIPWDNGLNAIIPFFLSAAACFSEEELKKIDECSLAL